MTLNTTGSSERLTTNSSGGCDDSLTSFNHKMEIMYTYFYLLVFIPGLLLNTVALWVLCRHIRKKTKAVIFMINLAVADLAHILSLPLRIYYYFTHTWPFGQNVCLICFYLKYLNMYAAIVFLVCISVQRCVFLIHPFSARQWRRRYDLMISLIVWMVVGLACSPFILMRNSSNNNNNTSLTSNMTSHSSLVQNNPSCFKDLPIRQVPLTTLAIMITLNEMFGFVIPLVCISVCSIRITWSLRTKQTRDYQTPEPVGSVSPVGSVGLLASVGSSIRIRLQSVTSNGQPDNYKEKQVDAEKRRALRMVLSCSALFLFCFAPYHINFLLYMLVSQNHVSHCATRLAVKQFHPVSLCMASLSCCLNPLLYYFLTAEFRMLLKMRASSSSLFSTTVTSPTECPGRRHLLRVESTCSETE